MPEHTNRLIDETSPYLLQHAHNPVDWYPWGEDAFEKAKQGHKPVFLSIGYAACHWCHVMERESFENEIIANYLNEYYVSIKVDREERPDIDDIYMGAVQMLTGSGGWPLTVFLTPEGKPFWGGTYFPPDDSWGRPGFYNLLQEILKTWNERPEDIHQNGELLTQRLSDLTSGDGQSEAPEMTLLENATKQLAASYDPSEGGFGSAPKFPMPSSLGLALREYHRTGDGQLLGMLTHTLRKMARGGIYDQIGGGFARYSTDERWFAPHFEKMLYDNAQLAPLYFQTAQVTGDAFYRRIGCETLDYVLREMTHPEGGFYAAQDADSEGVEGKYYLWTPDQLREVLGEEDANLVVQYYGITERGNWPEGRGGSIAAIASDDDSDFAERHGMHAEAWQEKLNTLREHLYQTRRKRIAPLTDDKILTSWNGMMVQAMAVGARVAGEQKYCDAALRAVEFNRKYMRDTEGKLLRTWREGKGHIPGMLSDYACWIVGLCELYQVMFAPELLHEARDLTQIMIEDFYDPDEQAFFTTDGRDATLIVRQKDFYDGAVPSGNAMAVQAILHVSKYFDCPECMAMLEAMLTQFTARLKRYPQAHYQMLLAIEELLTPGQELVITGPVQSPVRTHALEMVNSHYLPRLTLAATLEQTDALLDEITLFEGRNVDAEETTFYLCENRVCQRPTKDFTEISRQLGLAPGS